MFRVIAKKSGKQVQAIEYEDLKYGMSEMKRMYPDCELSSVDVEAEKKEIEKQNKINFENSQKEKPAEPKPEKKKGFFGF